MTDPVVVGIDVAAARPCVGVALTVGRGPARARRRRLVRHRQPSRAARAGSPARRRRWSPSTLRRGTTAICCCAPRRAGRSAYRASAITSCCAGASVCTRCRRATRCRPATHASAAWMKTGFRYFEALKHMGFEMGLAGDLPGSFGQLAALLEAYPYARLRHPVGPSAAQEADPRRASSCACASCAARASSGPTTTITIRSTRWPPRSPRRATCRAAPARWVTNARGSSGCP